jgi:cytokinesis protein
MDTIFRKSNKTRSSVSSSASVTSPTGLSGSVPYSQLPQSNPLPVAGPSSSSYLTNGRQTAFRGDLISPPNTNPGLTEDGTPLNYSWRDTAPPIPIKDAGRTSANSRRDTSGGGGGADDGVKRVPSDASAVSNGLRYTPPSIQAMSPTSEFGYRPHPYAAMGRDTDTASIRSVSTINTVNTVNSHQQSNRDLGRYPNFDNRSTSHRPSVSTPNGRPPGPPSHSPYPPTPSLGTPVPSASRSTDDFSFPRPSDSEVEALYVRLLENSDVDAARTVPSLSSRNSASSAMSSVAHSAAASLPIETKWQLVHSDAKKRWEEARKARRKEDEMLRSGKKGTSAVVVKNSPEWYLKKMLDGNVTRELLSSLHVSLRTVPME